MWNGLRQVILGTYRHMIHERIGLRTRILPLRRRVAKFIAPPFPTTVIRRPTNKREVDSTTYWPDLLFTTIFSKIPPLIILFDC